jgi:hypothetical protein
MYGPSYMQSPEASLALRIKRLCGTQILGARRVTTGYGATQRWLIDIVSGSRFL